MTLLATATNKNISPELLHPVVLKQRVTFYLIFFFVLVFSTLTSYPTYSAKNAGRQTVLPPSLPFTHLQADKLASIGGVNAVYRDYKGFMWFGGQDGLARYDGNNLTIYRNNFDAPHSISNNYIYDILEDSKGQLWIATRHGLNRYQRELDQFIHYTHEPDNTESLSHNVVLTLYEHSSGVLWLGTQGGGVNRYDHRSDSFHRFVNTTNDLASLSQQAVYSITENSVGNLWIGTEKNGLYYLDIESAKIEHFTHKPKDDKSLSANDIRSLIVDYQDNLWIGTFGGGLNLFNQSTRRFTHFETPYGERQRLTHQFIRAMHLDRDSSLWIATENSGLLKFDINTKQFNLFQHDRDNPVSVASNSPLTLYGDVLGDLWIGLSPSGVDSLHRHLPRVIHYQHSAQSANSLTHNEVTAVIEDSLQNLWVGTQNGLNYLDRKGNIIHRYYHNPNSDGSFPAGKITALLMDSRGRLWVGTDKSGVSRLDPGKDHFVHFIASASDRHSVSHNSISVLYEDSQNRVWVGTRSGLNRFNENTENFTTFLQHRSRKSSLINNSIEVLYEDSSGYFWVGTAEGLDLMDRESGFFQHFIHDPQNANTLSALKITAIKEDSAGRLWIGTHGGGINLMNLQEGTFKQFGVKDGLPHNVVTGLLEDERGFLWVTTYKGLSRFDSRTYHFRNYDERHGIWGIIPSQNATISSLKGELLLGGSKGLVIFDPVSVEENLMVPQVILRDFALQNQNTNKTPPLAEVIDETEMVELTPQQNSFSFEFSVLSYRTPEENTYSYKLEGWDTNWSVRSSNRTANYANLPPGQYTFKVHGYNNEGIRSARPAEVKIVVGTSVWMEWKDHLNHIAISLSGALALLYIILASNRRRILAKTMERLSNPDDFETSFWEHEEINVILDRQETKVADKQQASIEKRNTHKPTENFQAEKALETLVPTSPKKTEHIKKELSAAHDFIDPLAVAAKIKHREEELQAKIAINKIKLKIKEKTGKSTKPTSSKSNETPSNSRTQLKTIAAKKPDNLTSTKVAPRPKNKATPSNKVVAKAKETPKSKAGPRVSDNAFNSLIKKTTQSIQNIAKSTIAAKAAQKEQNRSISKKKSTVKSKIQTKTISPGKPNVSATAKRPEQSQHLATHTRTKSNSSAKVYSVNLRALVDEILFKANEFCDRKTVTLTNKVDKSLQPVLLNVDGFKDTLFNLISNAIRICRGGEIVVSVETKGFCSLIKITSGTDFGITLQLLTMADTKSASADIREDLDIQYPVPIKPDPIEKITRNAEKPKLRVITNQEWNSGDDPLNFHILIVESDPVKRMILQCYLSDCHYRVSHVSTGKEAIKLMRDENNIDLVIFGLNVHEITGALTCRRIRDDFCDRDLPIICFSNESEADEFEYINEIGGSDIITMDVSKEDLINKINSQIRILQYYRSHKEEEIAESPIELRKRS